MLVTKVLKYNMRIMGPLMITALYYLLGLHVYLFEVYLVPVLMKRIGVLATGLWGLTGAVILYNIVFNHFLATIVKPGGLKDMAKAEAHRASSKHRPGRKVYSED
jgi:hypothetical protein